MKQSIKHHFFASKPLLILLGIIIIGFILRMVNLNNNFFFGHDQARDIHEVYEMITIPKLKIVGPGTDIPGLFSGPLFYYLLVPVYALSHFDPNAAAFLLICINITGIPLLYYLGKRMGDERLGLLAAFLWSVSYEQANFARFISNPSFISIATILFFAGCYVFFVKKNNWGLALSVIGIATAIHLDFYLVYLLPFYLLFYLLYRPVLSRKVLLANLLLLSLLLSTFVIAEIKFHFLGTKSLIQYILQTKNYHGSGSPFSLFIDSLSKSLFNSFFSFQQYVALAYFILLCLIVVFQKPRIKENTVFIFVWLLSTVPLFVFRSNVVGGNYIHSSIHGAIILTVAYAIWLLIKNKLYIPVVAVVAIIVMSNGILFLHSHFYSNTILSHQPMTYMDQINVINYTYGSAAKKPFSICTLSNPLFINQLWSTAYKISGEKRFGYLPYWSGPEQNISKTFLQPDKAHVSTRYLILEPSNQLPSHAKKATIFEEDKRTRIVEIKQFGQITVQKRVFLAPDEKPVDSQELSEREKNDLSQIISRDYRYSCYY